MNQPGRLLTAVASVLLGGVSAFASEPSPAELMTVNSVKTVTLRIDGKAQTVDLAGVDPFATKGSEAREVLKAQLKDKAVKFVPIAVPKGKKVRNPLGLLYADDEPESVNQRLIEKGYARVAGSIPFAELAEFQTAEAEAQRTQQGEWSAVAEAEEAAAQPEALANEESFGKKVDSELNSGGKAPRSTSTARRNRNRAKALAAMNEIGEIQAGDNRLQANMFGPGFGGPGFGGFNSGFGGIGLNSGFGVNSGFTGINGFGLNSGFGFNSGFSSFNNGFGVGGVGGFGPGIGGFGPGIGGISGLNPGFAGNGGFRPGDGGNGSNRPGGGNPVPLPTPTPPANGNQTWYIRPNGTTPGIPYIPNHVPRTSASPSIPYIPSHLPR